jgi:hypothetical protein
MHKNQVIIVIAVLVALLPFLGFPRSWEGFFQVVAGLSIVGISIWSTIDKKLSLKAKAQMRQARKFSPETVAPATPIHTPEAAPYYGRRVTDFYPKTGQPGRRASDLNPGESHELVNEDE